MISGRGAYAIIILAISVGFAGCWKTQQHDITRPDIPRYTLSGTLVDMDDPEQPVQKGKVILIADQLLYDADIITLEAVTDSTGFFTIDSVVPGLYGVQLLRDGYKVREEAVSISYRDTSRTYPLPKPLVSGREYPMSLLSGNPRLSWNENTLYVFGEYDEQGLTQVLIYSCVLTADGEQFNVIGQMENPMGNAVAFFHSGRYYYLANSHILRRYSTDGAMLEEIEISDPITGLTYDGANFWSVYRSKLQNRGADPATVNTEYEIDTEDVLENLTYGDSEFWAYSPLESVILNINREGEVLGTYHPVDQRNPSEWIAPSDLNYLSSKNQLWITYTFAFTKTIYSFRNPT